MIATVLRDFFSSSSFYLPAARSGILQGHKLIAGVVLSRVPLLGIEALNVGQLSGVVADFISNVINLQAGQRTEKIGKIADFLEKEMVHGIIERKTGSGKAETPEIYYKVNGQEFPLHRTSSMVSEIAPIVLFLRHLVREGDLLIIEEPEAHLHPDNQRVVARAIVKLVRSGVRVLVTTHSDYFVQQISNFVRLGGSAELRQKMNYGRNDYLSVDEVGAYLFKMEDPSKGSTVERLDVTADEGIAEDEFVNIAQEIYDESITLEPRLCTHLSLFCGCRLNSGPHRFGWSTS